MKGLVLIHQMLKVRIVDGCQIINEPPTEAKGLHHVRRKHPCPERLALMHVYMQQADKKSQLILCQIEVRKIACTVGAHWRPNILPSQLAAKLHEHIADYKCQPFPNHRQIKDQIGASIILARPACMINRHIFCCQPHSMLLLPNLDACMVFVCIHLKHSVEPCKAYPHVGYWCIGVQSHKQPALEQRVNSMHIAYSTLQELV